MLQNNSFEVEFPAELDVFEGTYMREVLQHNIMAAVWQTSDKNDWQKSCNVFRAYNIESSYI